MAENITVRLYIRKEKRWTDVELPLDITANEFIASLNKGYGLRMDITDINNCYFRSENPICLLRGNVKLEEYGLYNGTTIIV